MPRLKVLLVDLDGTLLSRGITPLSRLWARIAASLYNLHAFTPLDIADILLGNLQNIVPGAKEILRTFKEGGIILGIVTDRTAFSVVRYFKSRQHELALEDFSFAHTRRGPFDRLVQMPIRHFTHAEGKNHRTLEPVLEFLDKECGIHSSEVAFWGDTIVDFLTADAAGVSFIASSWGWTKPADFLAFGLPKENILKKPEDLLELAFNDWHEEEV